MLSGVRLFVTPWTAARQASLAITSSWSLLKLVSIESVMPSNHLILCRPLLLLPSVLPSIRVFSNESLLCIRWPKYWSFSFSISPSNEYSGLKNMWPTKIYKRSWPTKSTAFALWPFKKKKKVFCRPCTWQVSARAELLLPPFHGCIAPGCFTPQALLLPSPTHWCTVSPCSPPGLGVLRTCDRRKGQETKVRTTFKEQAKKRLKGTEG